MPTKEQKPLLGTKGARQGPQTLADLSTPLLIGISYTKEHNTGHRHPLRGDQQGSGGFTNMDASQCYVVIHHIGKRRGKGGNF